MGCVIASAEVAMITAAVVLVASRVRRLYRSCTLFQVFGNASNVGLGYALGTSLTISSRYSLGKTLPLD
jgi:hypothetical protein